MQVYSRRVVEFFNFYKIQAFVGFVSSFVVHLDEGDGNFCGIQQVLGSLGN